MRPVRCTATSAAAARPGCVPPATSTPWCRSCGRAPSHAGDDGALAVGGLDVRDLAAEYGTPAYVLDEDDLRARCRDFRDAFAGADVYYAGKAFLLQGGRAHRSPRRACSLDVCTGGELATALAAGMPPERIGFHGNNKSVAELARALDAGVGPDHRRLVRRDRPADRAGPRARASGRG